MTPSLDIKAIRALFCEQCRDRLVEIGFKTFFMVNNFTVTPEYSSDTTNFCASIAFEDKLGSKPLHNITVQMQVQSHILGTQHKIAIVGNVIRDLACSAVDHMLKEYGTSFNEQYDLKMDKLTKAHLTENAKYNPLKKLRKYEQSLKRKYTAPWR